MLSLKKFFSRQINNHESWYFLFLCVPVIALLITVIIPFFSGFYYSLTDWNGIFSGTFIGLKNYIVLIKDNNFWQSLFFSFRFTAVSVLMSNLVAFLLALYLVSQIYGRNFFKVMFFIPNLIGGIIQGFVFLFIFVDVFSSLGKIWGIPFLEGWLSSSHTSYWALVVVSSWKDVAYFVLIYVAFLQTIPKELYESSSVDGANYWQDMWHITVPMSMPAFSICIFLSLSNSLKLFDQNLALTGGGPGNSSEMVALNIYREAFSFNRMGYAQSKAFIFFLVVMFVSLIQMRVTRKKEVEL